MISESIRHYPHPVVSQASGLSALLHLCVAVAINMTDDLPSSEWKYNLDVDVEDLLDILMADLHELQPKFDAAHQFVNMMVAGRSS